MSPTGVVNERSLPASILEVMDPLYILKQIYNFWINVYMLYGSQLFRQPMAC